MSLLLIVSALGATGFITRLISQDDITDWLRDYWRTGWILLLGPRHPWTKPRQGKLWKFIGCHRCVGVWVAAGVFTAAYFHGCDPWFLWVSTAMAATFTVSLLLDAVAA